MTATFPESRWRRAGAKAREILDLSAEWNELEEAAREEYAKDVSAVADSELARRLAERRGVEPVTETPAAPSTSAPGAPDTSTVGADPAGQPAADPATLPEQTSEGTGEQMTAAPDGSTITGDGTRQALPPVLDQPSATPLDESGLVDGGTPPETPASADDPNQAPAAAEVPPTPGQETPADAGTAAPDAPSPAPDATEPTDEELAPYLATKDSVVAYLAEHPELRERLLVLESEGKARRSVLDVLSLSE